MREGRVVLVGAGPGVGDLGVPGRDRGVVQGGVVDGHDAAQGHSPDPELVEHPSAPERSDDPRQAAQRLRNAERAALVPCIGQL